MIKSFKHKGLEKFFYNDDRSGINTQYASKISRILDRLDASISSQDMNLVIDSMSLKERKKVYGQFGLAAIGGLLFGLKERMQ